MLEEVVRYPTQDMIERVAGYAGGSIELGGIPVVGLDCERNSEGYTVAIHTSDSRVHYIDSVEAALEWLSLPDDRLLFCNDACFLDTIMKWFGREVMQEFTSMGLEGAKLVLGDISLSSPISGGVFTIYDRKNHGRVLKKVCYLAPFYHMSGMLPETTDCYSVGLYASRIVDVLLKYNIQVGHLKSPGAIVQSCLRGVKSEPLPYAVSDLASNCYHTNWVTAFQIGSFKELYDYDIVSAYPYQAARLLSCSTHCGRWILSSSRVWGAAYGFCVAKIRIDRTSPVILRYFTDAEDWLTIKQLDCLGEWIAYITQEEIDFIELNYLGTVEILEGWWFIADKQVRPFEQGMSKLIALRARARSEGDKFASSLFKVSSAALQGKFMTSYYAWSKLVGGYMYNPVYAAAIVARTRISVAEFCLQHEDALVHIAVDGCTLSKKVSTPEGVLGSFRLTSSSKGEEGIVIRDGEYWMPSRETTFDPSILHQFHNKDYLVSSHRASVRSRHVDRFSDIGKPKSKYTKWTIDSIINNSHRRFDDYPQKCQDYLAGSYLSLPRRIGGTA